MTHDIQRIPRQEDEDIIFILSKKVNMLEKRVAKLETAPSDDLEIKTTAGDYAAGDSWNGRRVLNTADNTYKIFFNAAWQQILP